ncbi:two-component response regulator yesN [Desulfocucumis palustris]|uniref:Stage 0 sporulation protein A homolog n=1 Tax=Desulfocucumis palustris TaxID=1898651 RepID=A0A2L2X950_9FIRM|nr:response regulator [Desulfocucumis palustris]GBF32550.1 two-component response regulator yesN [Desulfocucumis palustris]
MKRSFDLLIAEDEPLERKVLRHLLEKSGLPLGNIYEAGSGREAVQTALANRPDIMVMDIRMPGMDGLEAAREIKEQLPGAVIIILTAYDRFTYSQKAIKIGVADFLLKPVQPEELYGTLRGAINRVEASRHESILPPGEMPVIPPGVREIAGEIMCGNPGQAAARWTRLANRWLESLPGKPEAGPARWFAWEVLVIVFQDLQQSNLFAGELHSLKNELGGQIIDISGTVDMLRWGRRMVDEFDRLFRGSVNFDQLVVHRVQQYIRENYSQELSLHTLAGMVHLNQAYLSRLFKQKTGISFTDFLTRVRLQEAKRLLLTTGQSIDEVAAAVGFKNNSYFTSVFKKREGINPSEFRSRQS